MEYIFDLRRVSDELLEQTARALEARTHALSREQYPDMWQRTDRLRDLPPE